MVEFFKNIKVDWLGKRWLFISVSVVLLLAGLGSLLVKKSFKYGVDFRGGTIVQVRFQQPVQVDRLRAALRDGGAANAQIQERVGTNEVVIEFEAAEGGGDLAAGREGITAALDQVYKGQYEILSSETVGPKVGADLRRQAVLATLYALGGILVYIAFRFEWIYGIAAVFAVFHDALITLGFFSIFDREINLTVIAALLTLVGYSVNDTIVVFDRVRENLKTRRKDNMEQLLNDSINQTLSRTLLTSGLTFLTVAALYLFGGEIINNFAFTLVVGIIIGTYSSIAIASPLVLVYLNGRARAETAAVPTRIPKPAKAK